MESTLGNTADPRVEFNQVQAVSKIPPISHFLDPPCHKDQVDEILRGRVSFKIYDLDVIPQFSTCKIHTK